MSKITLLLGLAVLGVMGCSQSVTDYRQQTPELRLDQFFKGSLTAWGVMHDWQGKQSLRFTAQLCGSWQGQKGDLYEVFSYSDGRVDSRHWQLEQRTDGSINGTAADVVGTATGQLAGNTLFWEYTLRIPYDGDTLDVSVKDWLYLIDKKNVLNRSTLHKYGITVGELTLSIQQQDLGADCAAIRQQIAAMSPN